MRYVLMQFASPTVQCKTQRLHKTAPFTSRSIESQRDALGFSSGYASRTESNPQAIRRRLLFTAQVGSAPNPDKSTSRRVPFLS